MIALLVRTARPSIASSDERDLERLSGLIVDWERFLDLAHRHCTLPMLQRNLRGRALARVPDGIADLLARQARATAVRNMQLAGELVRLVGVLEADGIDVIAYKGPTLAMLLYGDVALRQFGDLDLLVGDNDVARAAEALERLGYRATRNDALALDAPLPAEGQLMYVREYPRAAVELHWRVVQRQLRVAFEFPSLLARATTVDLGGRALRTLATNDLFLVLAVHHTKHRWERMQWIAEFAELVERRMELGLDIDEVLERARELGVERMVRLGMRLGIDLWKIDVPAPLRADIVGDSELGGLAREVYRALDERDGKLSNVADRVGFQRRARDHSHDRMAMRASRIFEPSLDDRSSVRLPRYLYPLYYIIRPLRLVLDRLLRR